MIRPLRVRHRATFLVLAPLLTLAFAAAIAGRSARPLNARPAFDARDAAPLTATRDWMWSPLSLRTRLGKVGERAVLELVAWDEPGAPDVLLYWSASEPRAGADGGAARLPQDVLLIGTLGPRANAPRRLAWPAGAGPSGWLVLYSLGHSEVLAATPMGGA